MSKLTTINEIQLKQDLKTCAISIKDYVKALENDIERKKHLIDKAIAKIKEQAKELKTKQTTAHKNNLKQTLNDALNKAMIGKGRIKGIVHSNKIGEFVNEYLKTEQ